TDASVTGPVHAVPVATAFVDMFVVPPAPQHGTAVVAAGVVDVVMRPSLIVSAERSISFLLMSTSAWSNQVTSPVAMSAPQKCERPPGKERPFRLLRQR